MATEESITQEINLDTGAPALLHRQLGSEIERLIRTGRLGPGDRLPTAQAFSAGCGISLTTVSRALTDLGKAGLLTAKPGSGTYVAQSRLPTTEILVVHRELSPDSDRRAFDAQVVEGMQTAYGAAPRRFLSSYVTPQSFVANEILAAARARCVDGLALVGRLDECALEAGRLAREIPCVCIAAYPISAEAGAVLVNPQGILASQLRSRYDAGQRSFAYVGMGQIHGRAEEMFCCFQRTMNELGVEARSWVMSFDAPYRRAYYDCRRDFLKGVGPLEPGTSVVMYHPQLADDLSPALRGGLDMISYTESRQTLAKYRNRVTILYGGVELQARAAVSLLEAIRRGEKAGQRCVRIGPEVYGPGGAS